MKLLVAPESTIAVRSPYQPSRSTNKSQNVFMRGLVSHLENFAPVAGFAHTEIHNKEGGSAVLSLDKQQTKAGKYVA